METLGFIACLRDLLSHSSAGVTNEESNSRGLWTTQHPVWRKIGQIANTTTVVGILRVIVAMQYYGTSSQYNFVEHRNDIFSRNITIV